MTVGVMAGGMISNSSDVEGKENATLGTDAERAQWDIMEATLVLVRRGEKVHRVG